MAEEATIDRRRRTATENILPEIDLTDGRMKMLVAEGIVIETARRIRDTGRGPIRPAGKRAGVRRGERDLQ